MRVLIASLIYKQFGPAMYSWAKAFRHLADTRPDVTFDHLSLYGTPPEVLEGGSNAIILAKYRRAREIFLKGNYDLFIALEDDMVIPEDGFTRLMSVDADIAYGLYVWRYSVQRWSAYMEVNEGGGLSLSQTPEKARELICSGGIVPTKGVGLGFTAIRRNVLQWLNFRVDGMGHNDWYFALDADSYNFSQVHDLNLICGHLTTKPTPRILWPDISQPELVRTEFL